MDPVVIEALFTERLRLDPLTVHDAAEMVHVLADPDLYAFTGGQPPSPVDLERRYRAQVGGSGDPDELWLNWVMRLPAAGQPIGFVQATIEPSQIEVAWTLGTAWQGNGYASEAALVMADWLRAQHAAPLLAWIHPDHAASHRVARAIGLEPTDEIDDDGEHAWR